MIIVKTKEDLIKLITDNPESYIEGKYLDNSLSADIYASSRTLRLKWNNPIANINESQKIRKKVNKDFKLFEDKKEKRLINNFIAEMIGNGLPENDFYTNGYFGFDFKKNKFELTLDGKEFTGNILCLGIDEHYDYYVISPEFKGVRKVYHDVGEIEEIGFDNIEEFAKTVMKFAIIQGSLNKKKLNKEDLSNLIAEIKNEVLKEVIRERLT